MMEDANDQDGVFLNAVENSVLAIRPNTQAELRFGIKLRSLRVSAEQIEGLLKSKIVPIRQCLTKLFGAVVEDVIEICVGQLTEFKPLHAVSADPCEFVATSAC